MLTDPSPIQIDLTPRFQKDLRDLAKRYRQVRSDLQPLIGQLQSGDLPGDRIAGVNYTVYKVRLKYRGGFIAELGGWEVWLKIQDASIMC